MKKMKALTILSVALMLTLSACGGGNSNTTSNGANTTENNTASNTTTEPAANNTATEENAAENEPAPAAIDLGGRVVKISMWWDGMPKGETAGEKASLAKIAELEEKYNMKLEFVNIPFDQYMDKFTTAVLAGEPMADISIMEFKRAIAPIKQGLVLPLSDFTTADNDINNEQKHVTKLPAINGAEYAFNTPGVSAVGMYYNRDLFKKLGLPDLQELYNNGEWNWDKFIEVAKQATTDSNNDGKKDTWGYSGWPVDAARHIGVTNGALFVNDTDLSLGFNDPKMAEALEFINRLYNKENVVKVKSGNKMDWNETNTFKDGDVAMSMNYDWNMGDLTFEVGIVPNPAGPQSDGKYTFANAAQNGYFIPKGVKDPQVVYQIFEELQDIPPTEEYLGQDWLESRFKNEADIKMAIEHVNGTGRLSVEEGVADFPIFAIMDEIIIKNQSVAATIEKNTQSGQAALDKLK
ncbi:ABC transporter substrate-binding protein [Paenibacillus montanisoli]|uniref:Carbohydrate ABC transporter substrate-binding protein n=1 Tax=Paenibacillus montanisoli TaxID=2081970 RepID=A0A328U280_9BACL|nr:extracellular solute-binding protein [Paenibacillus montanisoli]RAP76162.1 carbohydrate ABC transporter substrate-binding protein [Paenibacillus montanisoli]